MVFFSSTYEYSNFDLFILFFFLLDVDITITISWKSQTMYSLGLSGINVTIVIEKISIERTTPVVSV